MPMFPRGASSADDARCRPAEKKMPAPPQLQQYSGPLALLGRLPHSSSSVDVLLRLHATPLRLDAEPPLSKVRRRLPQSRAQIVL